MIAAVKLRGTCFGSRVGWVSNRTAVVVQKGRSSSTWGFRLCRCFSFAQALAEVKP
jgi:hypothetical protein